MDYVLGVIHVILIRSYLKDMSLKKSIFLIPLPMPHFVIFGLGHPSPLVTNRKVTNSELKGLPSIKPIRRFIYFKSHKEVNP